MAHNDSSSDTKPNNISFQDDSKPDFNGVPSQALDAVRMRLAQLTHSLRRIRDELSRAELPQWYTLQSQLNVTLSQLLSVTSTLEHFESTLDSSVVYPLPKFPTTSHENLLTTLLRKKYAPEVDEWIKVSEETSGIDSNTLDKEKIEKMLADDKSITRFALGRFAEEFEMHNFKGFELKNENEDMIEEEMTYTTNSNHYKPTKPFAIEDILSFTYSGKLEDQPKTDTTLNAI